MNKTRLFVVCLAASALSCTALAASNNSGFSKKQVNAIEQITANYLINHPEILLKVSQALQQKEQVKAQQSALSGIKSNVKALFNDPKSPTVGNPNASVELVEFFDYQCGHCKAMGPIISDIVKNNRNIKVIFKELPIFGGNSRYAAKVALAARQQNKYYPLHNALFAAPEQLDPPAIFKIAKNTGLNVAKLKADMNAPWIRAQLKNNFNLASTLKLGGTPAFIVANRAHTKFRFIPGSTSEAALKQQIAAVK
ncbi:MAG: DsbA family protein [Halieaceae bacterium]|jgi:protein-disulfide isomerase|nr:DsbA family protein [Halieaceae bacterium]